MMVYSYKDASREEGNLIDDSGEPITRNIQATMNGCWWSGLWAGLFLACTPGIVLIIIGLKP
jgi:hypothetical protein